MRYVNATLKAAFLFNKNVHYLVRGQEVLLIDEHTGRTMPGRRMSEGIHQALQCKENTSQFKKNLKLSLRLHIKTFLDSFKSFLG